jgi:extracellular factor (EF) 3-hydroxypalmitic acid methyl ester biosynthesis protein
LDFSRETLDYTSGVLGGLKNQWGRRTRLQYVESNVRKLLRSSTGAKRRTTARYDLIYCAGLFDYLPDAVCAQLLEILYEWLEPGGLLLSTNVKTTRAIELSLDYMLDWKLICRDQAQFEGLVPGQAVDDLVRTIGVDQGYNLFLEVRRAYE